MPEDKPETAGKPSKADEILAELKALSAKQDETHKRLTALESQKPVATESHFGEWE